MPGQDDKGIQLLEVSAKGGKTAVRVYSQDFFEAFYSDGETDGDPVLWGIVLADVFRHVAKAHRGVLQVFSDKGYGPPPPPEDDILRRILRVFVDEMDLMKDEDRAQLRGFTLTTGGQDKQPSD
jgi:hypothetical protein